MVKRWMSSSWQAWKIHDTSSASGRRSVKEPLLEHSAASCWRLRGPAAGGRRGCARSRPRWSRRPARRSRSGRSSGGSPQCSSRNTPGARQLGQRDVEDALDLGRGRAQRRAGRSSRPTTGTMWLRLTTVDERGQAADQLRPLAGSSATSSWASRSAPASGVSPGSSRPPGKLISPRWLRRAQRAAGEHHLGALRAVVQGHQHRGRAGVRERRREEIVGSGRAGRPADGPHHRIDVERSPRRRARPGDREPRRRSARAPAPAGRGTICGSAAGDGRRSPRGPAADLLSRDSASWRSSCGHARPSSGWP